MRIHKYNNTGIFVNINHIVHNYNYARSLVAENCKVLAVVKADAYGHGALEVSRALQKCGAEHFAVANIDEAIALRKGGITGMILILGYTFPSQYADLYKYDISQTVSSPEQMKMLDAFVSKENKPIKIHIKLDTGMNRTGFHTSETELDDELKTAADIIKKNQLLVPEGIFSHFAKADTDKSYTDMQYRRFIFTVKALSALNCNFTFRHICNSAGTLQFPQYHLDMVRFGIGLYGCSTEDQNILNTMTFKARIVGIHEIEAGEGVGYGSTFIAKRRMRIAVVSAGYADGVDRHLSGKGYFLIKDKKAKILGRICMDMTMVDISKIENVKLGDEVTVFGLCEKEILPPDEMAELAGTISYELLCRAGIRSKKEYIY